MLLLGIAGALVVILIWGSAYLLFTNLFGLSPVVAIVFTLPVAIAVWAMLDIKYPS